MKIRVAAILLALLAPMLTAIGQVGEPASPGESSRASAAPDGAPAKRDALDGLNPISLLDAAMRVAQRADPAPGTVGPPDPSRGPGISSAVSILVLLTVISLAPSIMLMTTCFMRITIVLGLLRQAIGTQGVPPPQVALALSLFMTLLVMTPTLERINHDAIQPYRQGTITDPDQLWNAAKQPIRDFMFDQIEATGNWSSLYMVLEYRGFDTSDPASLTRADVDMVSLVPAFMLSELKTAFLMGFRVYLPFLVIDMVVSSLLISMSMMMLPPVLISLPFKLLLFVLVDGWTLVVGSLMTSFAQGPTRQVAEGVGWMFGGAVC